MRRFYTLTQAIFYLIVLSSLATLFSGCQKDDYPIADFSFTNNNCNARCAIPFQNLSNNLTDSNFLWSFGDGSSDTSRKANITHTYSAPGIYQVRLQATNENGTSEKTAFVTIRGTNVNFRPTADFEVNNDGCKAPCNIQFKNLSEGAIEYRWKIGSNTRTDSEPSIFFETPGQYNVELTAINKFGESKKTKTVLVKCNAIASFSRLTLLQFPLFRPNGSSWDQNSCCPDVEMRVFDVDNGVEVIIGPYIDNMTPGEFWYNSRTLNLPNSNQLRVEFWDFDGPGVYEFIGQTDAFTLDKNPLLCRTPSILIKNASNTIRATLDLTWN